MGAGYAKKWLISGVGIRDETLRGEDIRDWHAATEHYVWFPYDVDLSPIEPDDRDWQADFRRLWPLRMVLANRATFQGKMADAGLHWYEFMQYTRSANRTPLSIAFAEVATHNHFVLDRGGKVFRQTAPIIKLPANATEEDYLALLAYLNSSTACFYMRQVAHQKQMMGADSIRHTDPTTVTFAFNPRSIGAVPVPRLDKTSRSNMITFAARLEREAKARASLAQRVVNGHCDEREAEELERISLERMVSTQEELDWFVYDLFGLLSSPEARGDPAYSGPLAPGHRPFEVRLRETTDRRVTVDGFSIPTRDELDPRRLTRVHALSRDGRLDLLEQPQFKRRWIGRQGRFNHARGNWTTTVASLRCRAVCDSVEERLRHEAKILTLREVLSALGTHRLEADDLDVSQLLLNDALPFNSALRLKESGLQKHAAWEAAWELQRREDSGEPVDTPIPPKYKPTDFVRYEYCRLRGKLNVPKERFISYPGAETDDDPSPLIGWAGWDHLQRAQALSGLYMKRKTEDGWDAQPDKLVPLLAGLLELVPWLKQWHNDPDPNFGGQRLGDYFATFVESEARSLGKSLDDLRAWRPEKKTRRKKTGAGKSGTRRKRAPKIEPAALIEAVRKLDGGPEGVELAALASHLEASNQTVSKLAATLVDKGQLVLTSARPKRWRTST